MLENKCRTCGRDLDSGFNCPVCANKTMTTPTKEQIDDIIYEHLPMGVWGIMIAKLDIDERIAVVENVCLCWEKIRNSPK